MKKKKASSKKEIPEETLPYLQAKKLSERWSFYLQSHGGKSFFAYSGDGVHYYAYKNKTWSPIKPRELNVSGLKDGKKVVYPAKSISYEAFLARSPEGPYPGLEEDPDLIVGDLDLNKKDLFEVIRFANEIHSRQKDRGGHPYVYHPIWVAEHVSDGAKKVALLHDSMEDCGVNEEKLRQLGLSEKEVLAVKALTRQGSENTLEGYFAYVKFIRENNPLAYEVKQADLLMNMDLRRLPTLGVLDLERAFKYEAALMEKEKEYLEARHLIETSLKSRAYTFFLTFPLPKKEADYRHYAFSFIKALSPDYEKALLLFHPYRSRYFAERRWNVSLIKELPFADLFFLAFPEREGNLLLKPHLARNKVVVAQYKEVASLMKKEPALPLSPLEIYAALAKASR